MDVARTLLKYGADPALQDRNGMTPLSWALCQKHVSLFLMLASGAPHLGSPQYQLLRSAYCRRLQVEAQYHGTFRDFRVMKLGWTNRDERCLAWQYGTTGGWRCFKVDVLFEMDLGLSWVGMPEPGEDERPPECVAVQDEIEMEDIEDEDEDELEELEE